MSTGYAARAARDLAYFHAQQILDQLDQLPERFRRDLNYVRLMMDLTDQEFETALQFCERHSWIALRGEDPEPMH